MGFFRDLMLEIGTDPVACLEKNLATCTLGLLESDPERELTLFEEEWEIIHLLKALLWSQGSSCGANLEPVATDPVRGTIVSRYRERYNTALFIQPVPGRLDGYPDDFEMAEREDGAAIYTEGAVRMLKPGGMLITIVPTRLLAGKRNAYFRSYLRQHLIPAAIIEFKPRRTSGTCSCLIGTVSEDSDPPNEDVFMASPVEREEKGASFLEDIQSELFEHLHSFYS